MELEPGALYSYIEPSSLRLLRRVHQRRPQTTTCGLPVSLYET